MSLKDESCTDAKNPIADQEKEAEAIQAEVNRLRMSNASLRDEATHLAEIVHHLFVFICEEDVAPRKY